jgi:DNA-binding NtrC family response regulator
MEQRVLIVDDVPELAALLERQIRKHGFEAAVANTGAQARAAVRGGFRGIILLDLMLPDVNGLELLDDLQALDKDNPVLIMTAHGTVDLATEALKKGAFDFLEKDKLTERLVVALKNASRTAELASQVQHLSEELQERFQIVAQSVQMKKILSTLKQIKDSTASVMIEGESGTGKELVARALHNSSNRHAGPFVAVNCAGIPATLLESELFGYEKGAFTGATKSHIGKFEAANGGTIFLDEVGEMDLSLQAKLLRVIQEREVEPLGSNVKRQLDVRIVSATNKTLIEEVVMGRFRDDLYYRLSEFPITVPPLRERPADVSLLANHFTHKFAAEEGKQLSGLTHAALESLKAYSFPGNIRELQNIIRQAVIAASGKLIDLSDLPGGLPRKYVVPAEELAAQADDDRYSLRDILRLAFPSEEHIPRIDELEHEMFRHAYELCGKNIRRAAMRLDVSRPRVYRHLGEIRGGEEKP